MYKKSTLLVAMAMTVSMAFASAPKADFSALQKTQTENTVSIAGFNSGGVAQEFAMSEPAVESLSPALQQRCARAAKANLTEVNVAVEQPVLGTAGLTATLSNTPVARTASKAMRSAGKVTLGDLISKDVNYKGQKFNFRLNIEKAPEGDNTYIMSGFYGQTTPIGVYINESDGTVEIPCQQIAVAGDDNIMMCSMTFSPNPTYNPNAPITGRIDANGVITLDGWGLLITEGANAGRGYNFFTNSEICPANGSVTATNMVSGSEVSYSCLIEQVAENAVTFYGLSGVACEAINGRLTGSKQVLIPNSYVATNTTLGDFFIYPLDLTTGRAVPGQNLVGNWSEGKLNFAAWAVAARSYPTSNEYVYTKFKDVTVTSTMDIEWPKSLDFNMAGEGTASSPYIVKTVDDFRTISQKVSEGENFKGKYFNLGADLDFSSVNGASWIPAGDSTNPFEAVFDGAGHTMKNLIINSFSFEHLGVFGYLGAESTVKNLTLENIRFTSTAAYTGLLAGCTEGTIDNVTVTSSMAVVSGDIAAGVVALAVGGKVTNCQFQGSIQGPGSVAGIVGQAGGIPVKDASGQIIDYICSEISNCHTRANLIQTGYFSTYCRDNGGVAGAVEHTNMINCSSSGMIQDAGGYACTGGVVGRLLNGSNLLNSFSTAAIQGTGNASIGSTSGSAIIPYEGGVVGYTYGAGDIRNCYSSSYMYNNNSAAAPYVGGLVGYFSVRYSYSDGKSSMDEVPNFQDCYFSGQVLSAMSQSHKNIYGSTFILASWTGEQPYEVAFTNCSYDKQVALIAGDDKWGKPTSYFINGIPAGFDSKVWKAQTGRYPVIADLASLQASELSSAPMILADGQNADKVSKNFRITPADNVTWGIADGENIVQQNNALAINGSDVTIKDSYANVVLLANSKDGWGRKYYRLGIVPKWFEGEGTAESPYLLKNASDFEKLNTAVATFGQSHIGDYFELANDIDFANSTFNGVATGAGSSYPFGGHLDGKGHSIHNLTIFEVAMGDDGKINQSSSKSFAGLISVLYYTGSIKNLTIADDCLIAGYSYVGGVAGASFGRIENCRNFGTVKAASNYSGGITGFLTNATGSDGELTSTAIISRCYNAGRIGGVFSSHGGITGCLQNGAIVELSQNDGSVYGEDFSADYPTTTQHNTIGGIVGNLTSNSIVDRCVNNGSVNGFYGVGGIAGKCYVGSIVASINNGIAATYGDETRRGGIIGEYSSKKTIENNYYDSSVNIYGAANNGGLSGINSLSSSAMASANAFEGLSTDDFDFTEGLYPVLKDFKDEKATKALRSMIVYFKDNQSRSNVIDPVSLNASAQWSLETAGAFSIKDNVLSVAMPTDNTIPTDVLTASLDGYTKSMTITAIPAILEGAGTEASPFLIQSTDDWMKLADFMMTSKYEYAGNFIKLVNDLDFQGKEIELLAVNGTKFGGTFLGNGKTISNYTYTNANSTGVATSWKGDHLYRSNSIGLFGTIAAEGTVKDLTVEGSFTGCTLIGGIAGEVYGKLENCEHKGEIYASSSGTVAGVANKVYDGGVILNCVNSGKVTCKSTYASGIVNTVNEGGLVEGCVNKGTVNPGTTGAFGIAYNINGAVRNSGNRGTLKASGIACGIGNTLGKNATLDNCFNEADILVGEAGGNVAGIVYNTTDNTTEGATEATSWIRGCYNTGALTAKTNVFGITSTIKKGVVFENNYNTGDVTAVTGAFAYGVAGAITVNTKEGQLPTVVSESWNSGAVTAATASSSAAAGFAKSAASDPMHLLTVDRCYNIGDVKVLNQPTATSNITVACGLFNTISGGTITNCFNAGEVYGLAPCNGGVAGYISGNNCTLIENCFNYGKVTGSNLYLKSGVPTEGNTNGTAGGLFGYISTGNPVVRNCYNSGDVIGNNRVGGIAGGMFRPTAVLENCYNSGKVVCENNWWSGTIYTATPNFTSGGANTPYFDASSNVYYDADVTPGKEYRNFPGSAKTTAEMADLDLGEAFVKGYGYPYLAAFDTELTADVAEAAAGVSTALALTTGDDTFETVTAPVVLAAAPSITWTQEGEGEFNIDGAKAIPAKKGAVTLTASSANGEYSRSFSFVITEKYDGVDEITDGRTVKSTTFIALDGRMVANPVEGQAYVVKVNYTDGTSTVTKAIYRK